MPISQEEQTALDATKVKVTAEQVQCWTLCREYARMTVEELKHSGHKSPEAAVLSTVNNSVKRVEKLWKEFLRQFPDEGVRSR